MLHHLRPLIYAASCCLAWMCSGWALSQNLPTSDALPASSPPASNPLAPSSQATVPAMAETPASLQPEEVLRVGKALEQQRRWQEAIQHYEKSLKLLPLNKQITERMQISRVHLDVTRRYADRSFIESVERSTSAQSIEVYQDVVSKLETYYVDSIDYYKLALYGTAFLEVALTEREFIQKHLSKTPAASIENFRRNVHRLVFGKKVGNANELKNLALLVASEAQEQIGLMPTATLFEFISGSVGLLDPYSSILTPGEYREIMSQIEGNLIGLGVELWAEGNELRIVDVFKGSPAAQAGLLPGHYILEVDGQTIVSIGAKRAADMLRGPENSSVKLVISSGGDQSVAIDVVRRRVEIPSVSSAEMRNGQIGYIRITNFQKTTVNEVSRALFDLSSQGMKSLVIDLRRNPGGLLESAVELADYFIVRGGIVSTRGRNTSENRNYTAHAAGTWDMPLVVLIDAESASASEIFAGAIRDHDRGYIVGQISYGKGSVQGVFPSERGIGGLRLTVSRFYSPSGTAISQRGITPHVMVPEEPDTTPTTLVALKPPVESVPSQGSPGSTETGANLTAQRPVLQPASEPAAAGKPDRVLEKGLEIAGQIAAGRAR
ncbi:MAG: PDZ domain-containing protein [Planctomycetota bacterium]|nr:MAG: PDZ domain-containing protein [Planctomycetota bacterium]